MPPPAGALRWGPDWHRECPLRAHLDGLGRLGSLFPQLRPLRDSPAAPELQTQEEPAVPGPGHRGAEMSPDTLPR